MSDYENYLLSLQQQQQVNHDALSYSLGEAVGTNPDEFARMRQLSQASAISMEQLPHFRQEAEQAAYFKEVNIGKLWEDAPVTARTLSNPEVAGLAHDNVGSMSGFERVLKPVKRFGGNVLAGLTTDFNAAAWGIGEGGTRMLQEMTGSQWVGNAADWMQRMRKTSEAQGKALAGDGQGDGIVEAGVYSGARSFGQMATGTVLSIMTGSPMPAVAMAGVASGGQAVGKGLDKGLPAGQALMYGAEDATAEMVTEMIPMGRFLKDLKAGAPFWKMLGNNLLREAPTEMAATAWQNANEWLNINPEKSLGDYVRELGPAEAQTLVAVATTSLLTMGMGAGANRILRGQQKAKQAEDGAKLIGDLNTLAAADKLVQRDPDVFQAFIEEASKDGAVQHVFVDANTLMQSGIAEQVAAVSPSVAEQLPAAAETGGRIAIPVGEYLTRIAPTEYAQSLVDHLATEPDGMTRAQAQQFMQSHVEELQAEVERTLAEKQVDDTFKASAEAVRGEIRTQLDTAARFTPQVNDAYSSMVGNFYAVTAAKLGTTPEELFKRYPLKIGAERIDGQQFDQGQAPTGEQSGEVYNQSRKGKRDDYTLDLFGIPDNTRADTPAGRPAAGRQERPLSRDDAPGTYAARTELVEENTRELGTDRVTTPQEAAQAMAYLAKGAVERFDALVTDADGKPLAIVGAFKGALTQASVFPSTLAAEAFRVNGAANIWFAHNHPSGTNELSNADRQLHSNLAEVFRGSEIKARGIFAIAGKEGDGRSWVFEPTPKNRYSPESDVRGATTAPGATASVPVVERVYTQEDRLGPAISSPAVAKSVAKNLSGGEAGVVLMTAQNEPVAFVPVDPAEAGVLRRGGRMDALYRALSVSNAGAAIIVNNGMLGDQVVQNLAGLFNSLDARVLDVMDTSGDTVQSWAEQGRQFNDRTFNQEARGAFNPASLTITMLKGADLSTFLHESGHFFLEVQTDIAAKLQQEAEIFGMDTLKPGERQILADNDALLRWFGIESLAEWYNLDFEQKRSYHEQFARGFEAYLFEGKAPSIELQGLFQRFRAWLLSVYRELKALNVELTDEVRGVFDRMLATDEQITLAEQGRSLMPLFETPDQAGMSVEAFAAYQAMGREATETAQQDLQARGLRDMQWLHNAKGREVKRLQKLAKAQRAEVEMEVRREVMHQPLYRAWQFLTGRITEEDKLPPPAPTGKAVGLDPARDSLFEAIAKLGGLDRAEVESQWGFDKKERSPQPGFGQYLLRRTEGLSLDAMAELLAEQGYLPKDENGKHDLRDFEEKFQAELAGDMQYSLYHDYQAEEARAGDNAANVQAIGAGRIDLGELKAMGLPAEVVTGLQARRMTARNGLHPDIVAELFGFTSGDELVRKLAAATPLRDEIAALTDTRMLEQYGDLVTPEAIDRAADAAIHNDARMRMVATEAQALERAVGNTEQTGVDKRGRPVRRPVIPRLAREMAQRIVAGLMIRNIRPSQYANAETRAAKAAEKASRAGDLATAAAEKRNQLVQGYTTKAAYDAQAEVDAGLRYLKKFEGDIKTLDADYADQIGQLLERFDLRKGQSNKAVDKRTALAKWVEQQREAGLEPDVPDLLLDEAQRTHYRNLTLEEFRGLVDTVKQIEHLGRLKHKLLTAADQREFAAVRDEIAASITVNAGDRTADARTPTTNAGRAVQGLKRFWASHIKAATWARVFDGGKDGGPVWEYIIRTANERSDRESTMRAEATQALSRIMAPLLKAGKMSGKGKYFPSVGRSFNRQEVLAIALNMGNEGNTQRLLGGEGWTLEQIKPVLQSLTAQEWDAVQAVWDHFESYRPEIGAKERRVYGKEPTWVEPRPFAITTADGQSTTVRGGYYPIKYDPAASQRAEEHADAEGAKRQMQGAYTSATTRRSFTKTRVEEVSGRPLLYSLSGVYSGVNDVIHDLAWHEWLIDVNRLLRSNTIDAAIRDHYGPQAKQQLKSWVEDIAEGDKGPADAGEAAWSWVRQGVSAAGLGFNVVSAAMQVLGFTQSIVRVGAQWMGRGLVHYLSNPVRATRGANELSDFMANRSRTRFRELNELRNQVQDQSKVKEFTGRYAYFLMMRAQQIVDVPTWWAGYEKAIANGHDEARAVALADQAVIDAQGGGETKDLSAIERGGPAMRLFTVFYSFMNTALNLGVTQTMNAKTPRQRAKLAVDYLMLYTVPAVLGSFLRDALTPGDAGDDDPDELVRKLIAEQLGYLMGLMVVVREFSEVSKIVTGVHSYGYQGPAGLRPVSDGLKFGQQAVQGEFDDAFRKAAINVLGDFTGLPSAQVNRTITGAQALAEGKTTNPAAVAFGFQEPK